MFILRYFMTRDVMQNTTNEDEEESSNGGV